MDALDLLKIGENDFEIAAELPQDLPTRTTRCVGISVSATMAIRLNFVSPSEIALTTATRSAQIVRPYVAFSTLQPATMTPAGVSERANLNPE